MAKEIKSLKAAVYGTEGPTVVVYQTQYTCPVGKVAKVIITDISGTVGPRFEYDSSLYDTTAHIRVGGIVFCDNASTTSQSEVTFGISQYSYASGDYSEGSRLIYVGFYSFPNEIHMTEGDEIVLAPLPYVSFGLNPYAPVQTLNCIIIEEDMGVQ